MFVTELLEQNRRLLTRWATVDWQAADPAAVAGAAAQLVRDANQLQAISLLALAEHDRHGGIAGDGDASTADWVAKRTRCSKSTASRDAARSKRLRNAPETSQAAAEGRLSTEQADALASVITDQNAEAFRAREAELIEQAAESLDAAIEAAKRFREASGESAQERADRLHAARRASVWVGDDGMIHGRQQLSGDGGAAFRNIFQTFVDREHRNRPADDPRTNAQRRADAAVEMARHAAAALHGDKPGRPPQTVVTVHIDLHNLTEGSGTGEDQNTGLPITGEAARRLACDAGIVRLITNGGSQIIDIGRQTRSIPTATRRAVLARDGGCTYPGCTTPPDWVQVHHIQHWTNLGDTNLDNLTATCHTHHHLIHEGQWTVTLDPATQRVIWHSPDKRTLIGQRRRQPTHQNAA